MGQLMAGDGMKTETLNDTNTALIQLYNYTIIQEHLVISNILTDGMVYSVQSGQKGSS